MGLFSHRSGEGGADWQGLAGIGRFWWVGWWVCFPGARGVECVDWGMGIGGNVERGMGAEGVEGKWARPIHYG